MPEAPKKNKQGKLIARFDILDTPNGRIAYTLAKYGYHLGISSRGSGETYTGRDGREHVDKDTYDFVAFDLVLIPAVKAARLNLVTESLETGSTKLILDEGVKKALNEALENSNEQDKKIMNETLHNLNLDINTGNGDDNIYIAETENTAADNNGDDMIRDLQKLLKENRVLSKQVKELQEQLSVCYTKEAQYNNSKAELDSKVSVAKVMWYLKNMNETLMYYANINQNNQFYVNITTVKGKCFKCAINVDDCKTVDGRCKIMKIIEKIVYDNTDPVEEITIDPNSVCTIERRDKG